MESTIKEHRDACSRWQLEKSTTAEHAFTHHHPNEWNEIKVLDGASRLKELLIKEALHIWMMAKEGSLNRDGGVEIAG